MSATTAGSTSSSSSNEASAQQQWSLEVVRPKLKNTLHSNGHTSLEYDRQSSQIISCNHADNEIYLFQVDHIESVDLTSSEHRKVFGDDSSMNVMFVKISGNNKHALVGLSNFRVELYTYPEFEKDGLLVRFESAPTCAKMNCDNSFVAIGSQDGSLKVVEMESPHRFKLFEGHSGPILDIEYDPSEDFLVSSSCDGTVKVWNSGNRKCLKTFSCVPTSNDLDNSKTMAKCAWQPRIGNYLAVPAEKCVKFHDRRLSNFLESPKFVYKLDSVIRDFVSMVCWHPDNGDGEERSLIALVTVSTDVVLTELVTSSNQAQVVTLRCIQGKQNKVTSFLWIPSSSNFVIADDIGMLYFYTGCVPSSAQKKDLGSSVAANASGKQLMNQTVKGADEILNEMAIDPREDKTAFEGDDDAEDGSISLDQIKQSYVMQVEKGPLDDMDGGNVDSQGLPIDGSASAMKDSSGGDSHRILHSTGGPAVEVISYQAAFQPSCSPLNLSSRYMKWNLVGIVRRDEGVQDENLPEDDQTASITVEFHDSTFHHSMHLKDEHGYTLADLSEEALLLAAPSSLTSVSKQSVITCNTFSFWDHSNQWSAELPPGEKTVAVCIGSQSWLAVATSRSLLRIFSVSGIQLSVVMLSGHLVSIAAGSDELLHVFQPSQTLQRDRFYSSSIYKVTGFEANLTITEQFPLCEADDSVTWVGFSQEGDPVVAFLSGPLYVLKRSSSTSQGGRGHCWMPVFNFKQHLSSKSDRIWIVGLAGKQLRAIYCKASKFPAQLPKPIVLTYPLGLPLCNVDSEQSQIEMQLQNQRLFSTLSNQEVQSAFLKLFALACRTDRDCRAVDICNLMPNEETVILAIKYATKLKKLTLAQKLSAIAHEKSSAAAAGRSEGQNSGGKGDEMDWRRGGEFEVQDENSRSLFNSQHNSQSPFLLGSSDSAGAQDETSMDATNSDASLVLTNNPILRRANSKALLSKRLSTVNDITGAGEDSTCTDVSAGQDMPKRRVNPFLRDSSSGRLNSSSAADTSLSSTLGSSVFDSMQFLKPDKIRSKSSSSSDMKSLGKRKSTACNSQQKGSNSKVVTANSSEDCKHAGQLGDISGQENCGGENAPKKMTPFQCYFQQVKPSLQEEDVSKSSEELLSAAMKLWKKMSTDEKAQFTNGGIAVDVFSMKRKSSTVDDNTTNNDADSDLGEAPKKSKFDSSALLQQFSFS